MAKELNLQDQSRAYLEERWLYTTKLFEQDQPQEPLGEDYAHLKQLIQDCLTSSIKTYHYVLPTQLLCKSVDPSLDAHALQVAYGKPGAFDARTIAHKVVVPFDQANYRVLGGSTEPYVSKPLRCPAVTIRYREQQRQKSDWDKLTQVLDAVENADDEVFTRQVFDQILFEVYKLLANVIVTYPTPNRISLHNTYQLIEQYLSEKSGGDRIEAVCTALFQIIGEKFGVFDEIRREKVNAADASSGMVADIECWLDGEIILLVEVKDRSLTLTQLDAKLDIARSRKISEILFIAEQGKNKIDEKEITTRITSEFTSGQNIYVASFSDFSLGVFILLGEEGRVDFLDRVGKELDRVNSPISHRRAWANLLKQV
jgi:hypothetical protein